jgi:two-component system nitrogen regulation sensor histidine kinase NtrY
VRLSETDRNVLIEVEDNGVGLPNEPVEKLMEPYFTRRLHGTGLGLAIVRKIMEEHGGRLSLRSRPEGGACVSLAFPLAGAGERDLAAAAAVH